MRSGMADQRALDAIDRIERAIARIEQTAATPPLPSADDPERQRLRAAHDSLRRKVAGAIDRLDLIIDGAERG
jgi:hypothetical protein